MSEWQPALENFKGREDLVFVIDRFNYIEYKVTEIITLYIGAPTERKRFVDKILLNNAIVPFSGKLKLLFHIDALEGLFEGVNLKNDFHLLMQIRNQFAHTGNSRTTIYINESNGEASRSETKLLLESVNGNGELVEVERKEALGRFTDVFARLKPALNSASEKMKAVGA